LYASGPPWSSAFWLQPLQIHFAKSVGRLSDACIVSSDNFRRELKRMVPNARVELHSVPSGIGEPPLSPNQIAERDPHQWAIFGGTALVERSLRAFRQLLPRIPDSIAPRKLFVLGGGGLPGPFVVEADRTEIPSVQDRAKIGADIYGLYQRHASSESLTQGIAATLGLSAGR